MSKAICCLCNRRVSSFCILQIHSCILCSLCALYLSFNHLSCAANASAGANYFGSLLFTVSIGHTELPRLTPFDPFPPDLPCNNLFALRRVIKFDIFFATFSASHKRYKSTLCRQLKRVSLRPKITQSLLSSGLGGKLAYRPRQTGQKSFYQI